ncbi:G-patch domain-containing protein [Phascolomyces articulosus]|uniref:G-patch domain-containing protein n=1 Tax=Phascolomyces articulosus TaxID=60185 RepID=A0AAD5PFZ0_9FUNG|nr:G-patch domain-containing protein [Phascolomyces articulosus]
MNNYQGKRVSFITFFLDAGEYEKNCLNKELYTISYQLQPMSKFCRRQLHLLATAYKLKSYSFGTGAQRTPVLQRTSDTFLPNDRRYIDRFLDEAQNTIDAQSSILRKHRMDSPLPNFNKPNKKGKSGHHGKKDKKKRKEKPMSNPVENKVVGADVAPIGESNVGHRMLAAMGWKQGDALGANNDGITAPIEAIVRKKRLGLGS